MAKVTNALLKTKIDVSELSSPMASTEFVSTFTCSLYKCAKISLKDMYLYIFSLKYLYNKPCVLAALIRTPINVERTAFGMACDLPTNSSNINETMESKPSREKRKRETPEKASKRETIEGGLYAHVDKEWWTKEKKIP